MPLLGITVLKNNVPWGPFTREQIDDGLARGDFTIGSMAHAPGLKNWHPLAEVLDYVDRNSGPRPPSLPPLPSDREFPPIPGQISPKPTAPPVLPEPAVRPPGLPASMQHASASPPPVPSVEKARESAGEPKPEVVLAPASFIPRGIAFLIDCAILFVPVGMLFILGALAIEIPAWWHPISHQARMDEWDLLDLNTKRLLWLVAIGFGWLYGAGLESSARQATVGKRWMGIKVTDAQGERISFLRATGRCAAKYLSALPCFLGFIIALFSSRHLTLHDRLSDTRAVRG